MVSIRAKTSRAPQPGLLELPWSLPLAEWPDELAVRLPRGRHRHVVRFIEYEGAYFAFKELHPQLASREFEMLTFLADEGLPVVELVGVADDRVDSEGNPLDAILVTRHLAYALPFGHLFAGPFPDTSRGPLIDALAVLLVRIHLAGFFWGDCSLSNALFRRDAGALIAHLVDTETGELHAALSDGQRQLDLDIAKENILGGLLNLEAWDRLDSGVDPLEVIDELERRYEELWGELTRTEVIGANELWRIRERLNRLNDLGFDTTELELQNTDGGSLIRFRPAVLEDGHHRRELERLTGIVTSGENQARRLLQAIYGYRAWLAQREGRDIPEAIGAYRWLTERYEPTVALIPEDLADRLEPPEFFHQVLDHTWYKSEQAGHDVGLAEGTAAFIAEILPELPQTAVILPDSETDGVGSVSVQPD